VPQTPEVFGYDADGNTTNSGKWTGTWDAENRALSFATIAAAPTAAKRKVDCTYDYMGRRVQKIVSTNNGSAYISISTNRYIYDGWNLVAVLNSDSSLQSTFTWGLDLSGSQQGAGGVGGLISMTVYGGTNAGAYFYSYDGNGNVASVVNTASGALAGQWEYDPFGNTLRSTGPMAYGNPFLFSTKFFDVETSLSYYGYRYYDASAGRWLSRDPIKEQGGNNILSFSGNDLINSVDGHGLSIIVCKADDYLGGLGLTKDKDYAPEENNKNLLQAKLGSSYSFDGSLEKEIIWKMLQDDRVFNVKDLSVDNLKLNVLARKNIVDAITQWGPPRAKFPNDDGENEWNPAYWSAPDVVKDGALSSAAINDAFSADSASNYTMGCKYTADLILLKGVLDTIGAKAFDSALAANGERSVYTSAFGPFKLLKSTDVAPGLENPTMKNWVPGDKGYIKGGAGRGLAAGENILYMGNGQFWGVPHGKADSLGAMMDRVKGFSNLQASETGRRIYPGVGLQ
jgi:RHS repeat-associated protein